MKWLPLLLLATVPLHAELRLPAIISDHAMLQAGKPAAIWGWAAPGEKIKVTFTDAGSAALGSFTATADAAGKWSGALAPLKNGAAGRLEAATEHGEKKIVKDVLVGEVWLGGGQSNMEYRLGASPQAAIEYPEEAAEVARTLEVAKTQAAEKGPAIRYFYVPATGADAPQDDVKGNWVEAAPDNVKTFSAVAWSFGAALRARLHEPVGLVVSCVGATPVEAWMSREMLESSASGAAVLERHRKAAAGATPEKLAQYEARLKEWEKANRTPELQIKNKASKPNAPYSNASRSAPNRFYNGMIRGLQPYTVRGVIWFQADGNAGFPLEYSDLFQGLIKGWRADWKDELPFYFVEMNNMRREKATQPVEAGSLSLIREQQHGGLLQPKTGMVATIDLGTVNPHFPNKKPVGDRLAGLALRDCYGVPGQVNSPMYQAFAVEGNKVRLRFTDAEGLRVKGGGELKGFAIRGEGAAWVWATGKIEGDEIVVWSDQVAAPAAVRYAWASNPIISVENGAGLPLYPFRTDTESKE